MSWGPRDDAYTAFPPPFRVAPPVRRGLRFSREEYGHILLACGAPGAVYVAGPLTREQNGRVSLVGPLTNFVIALVFTGAGFAVVGFPPGDVRFYVGGILFFTGYINAFLGVFNMLPIPPLDGSKVFRWNIAVWAVSIVGMGSLLAGYFLNIL